MFDQVAEGVVYPAIGYVSLVFNIGINVLTLVVLVAAWLDFRTHKGVVEERLVRITDSWIGPARSTWPRSSEPPGV
jgi:hypothetical protein